ncbi:MAG TPA: GNAT family N-acetyltransferase [Methanocella sp.]|nr:GNAT family N-acetyltransferase [Methanocella sp.]
MSKMEFAPIPEKDFESYDALVDESMEGTLFHKSWWFKIFTDSEGINADSFEIFGAYNNGIVMAGFPIPYKKKLGQRWIINPRLTPYSGTVFKPGGSQKYHTENSFRKDANTNFAKIIRPFGTCLYYPFNVSSMDLQPFLWSDYCPKIHYTYILKIDSLDSVWSNIARKRRNDIKSSMKNGFQVTTGDIRTFTRLNDCTMKRQGHGRISSHMWEKIYAVCKRKDCAEIFTTFIGDDALASLLLVWDNKRSYYIGGGIDGNSRGGMPLLIWEAIKYTREHLGLNEFDFEGSSVPGIEFFFRNFGGELRPFFGITDRRVDLAMNLVKIVKR